MLYIPDISHIYNLELIQGTPQTNYKTFRSKRWTRVQENYNYDPLQPWIAVNSLTKEIVNINFEQPEPGRLVLSAGISRAGRAYYWYYDDIPRLYQRVLIAAVVFSIIATPLSLLCFIPALEHLKKAERSVQEDKVLPAREHCISSRMCLYGGIIWIIVFFTLAIATLLPVIVVFATI